VSIFLTVQHAEFLTVQYTEFFLAVQHAEGSGMVREKKVLSGSTRGTAANRVKSIVAGAKAASTTGGTNARSDKLNGRAKAGPSGASKA
jgi:hypothetical protein